MSGSDGDNTVRTEDAVEAILERAAPRPAPPAEDERVIRDAVYAEWQAVTGRHIRRRRMANFAIAATVLVAITVAFNQFRVTEVVPVQVASIDKSHGSIYLLGEQSELRELPDLATVSAGQTIVTGRDAGIGLSWGNGGSLRIDANTRIEFLSTDEVYLRSGRIYFDSRMAAITGSGVATAAITGSGVASSALNIETDHGTVTHLGTQYMTYVDDKDLTVSVREGKVAIDGSYRDETASAGQQLTLTGSARPTILDITGYGGDWEWIEPMAPVPQFDGRPVPEFLNWVSRETGLHLEYEGDTAEQLAAATTFFGEVEQRPMLALEFWMQTIDLDYRIEGGVIYVSAITAGGGQ